MPTIEQDSIFASIRERIETFTAKWDERLNLSAAGWRIGYVFNMNAPGKEGGVACSQVQWEYMHATITFFLACLLDMDDEELEDYVIHEFMHVVLNEMREGGSKHEERVVAQLVRAFLKLR